MKDYYTVVETSAVLNISRSRIYEVCRKLGIDTRKIDDAVMDRLKEAFTGVKKNKKNSESFEVNQKNVQSLSISCDSGATLEKRLADAKQKFDDINRSLAEYQLAIDIYGEVMLNDKNSSPYSNPVRKPMNDTLKQYNSLQKTINELEEKLKLTSTSKKRAIDD